jgi:23S rRNA pseudouridine2457 synthase
MAGFFIAQIFPNTGPSCVSANLILMEVYHVIYKPYQVLSQFSSKEGKPCLKDWFRTTPDVYPVGRLDFDSEGLLILTNDPFLNQRLLNPRFAHQREYWVQVEGVPGQDVLDRMAAGVEINLESKMYRTRPAGVQLFGEAPRVAERTPPIRFRKYIPTSWIRLVVTEGKNRQVRKMTAKVGLPTLRLIRYRIEGLTIEGMMPGEMISLDREKIYQALFSEHAPNRR